MFSVAALLATRSASAQSTEGLGRYERPVQVQLSVATSSVLVGSRYGDQMGTLRAIDIATHFHSDGPMLMRLDAWAINRRPSADNPRRDGLTQSLALAIVASGEFQIVLPYGISITPEVGYGCAPRARGDFEATQGRSSSTRTKIGWVHTAGVALRWRHFVIEQHLMEIVDADSALINGRSAPLSFGLRF
jgi:hypothetical protein